MLAVEGDDVLRILDCFGEGVVDRRDVLRAASMNATTYHNARRRLKALAERLPQNLRDKPSIRSREEMNMSDQDKKSMLIYEAIAHEASLDASERGVDLTPAEHEEARRIVGNTRETVRAKQRTDRAMTRATRVCIARVTEIQTLDENEGSTIANDDATTVECVTAGAWFGRDLFRSMAIAAAS